MDVTAKTKIAILKHRSFSNDKKSTLSTRQTTRAPAKSSFTKATISGQVQDKQKTGSMGQSTPVQIYFNPQFRGKYVRKVIDSFFTTINCEAEINDSGKNINTLSPNKQSLGSRIKGWRKKTRKFYDFSEMDTRKQTTGSPQRSILFDLSQQDCYAMFRETNLQTHGQSCQKEPEEQLSSNSESIYMKTLGQSRHFSQQSKRRNIQSEQQDPNSSITVSLSLNQGTSPKQSAGKLTRKLICSNQYFQQFKVYEQRMVKSKVRKYLQQQNALFQREGKIRKRGIRSLWSHSTFPMTLQYPLIRPVSQLLSKQFSYGNSQLDSYKQIHPSPYFHQLFLNRNEQLIDIITSMTRFIINNKGRVLTNSFQTSNLYKVGEKDFYLKDLGCSGILDEIKLKQKTIKHIHQPVWKQAGPNGKWLIRPEYLAPEVLQSYTKSDNQSIQHQPESVIAAQIWSLGCMILQLLTLIPLHSDVRCRVKSNPQNLRRGFLSIRFNGKHLDYDILKRKQKLLSTVLNRKIQLQLENVPVQKKVLSVLKRMLIYQPGKRIKPEQIIVEIKY